MLDEDTIARKRRLAWWVIGASVGIGLVVMASSFFFALDSLHLFGEQETCASLPCRGDQTPTLVVVIGFLTVIVGGSLGWIMLTRTPRPEQPRCD